MVPDPRNDPRVALLLPYGEAMAAFSASRTSLATRTACCATSVARNRRRLGRAFAAAAPRNVRHGTAAADFPASVRPNWRRHNRLPSVSAANLLSGQPVCGDATAAPFLKAAWRWSVTPLPASTTPSHPGRPGDAGLEVMAEATEALVAGSAIRMPQAWLKYVLATLLALLTTLAFFRGEPTPDIDAIFVATNLALLSAAFVGLTFFGFFFDIFASIGFVSLVFGLCRAYAAIQRGGRSATATTCRSSCRAGIAGSRSPACASCPTRNSASGRRRDDGVSIAAG